MKETVNKGVVQVSPPKYFEHLANVVLGVFTGLVNVPLGRGNYRASERSIGGGGGITGLVKVP